ncbi:MAG: ATP-dependent DNA helicase RecG [Bacteroidaceae bacterium]|nr:ATP-dependent DNA helicase RecG [Bacteroidaceae bacterium]MBR3907749.1 ATP-dependent DNA helicase RecG [Bacteroidaceae bacterium]
MLDTATRNIKFLPGVGEQRAALLSGELNIRSLHDLLYYFPYKYIDRSRVFKVEELGGHLQHVQLVGEIRSFEEMGEGATRRLVAHFTDGTAFVDLVWFKGIKYVKNRLKIATQYVVFGKPSMFNGRVNIAHPDVDDASTLQLSNMGLQPYYNTTEKMKRHGLNSNAMAKLVHNLFGLLTSEIPETLSDDIVRKHGLMSLDDALRIIHFPKNTKELQLAQYRLKFEELFYIQLNILQYARDRQMRYVGHRFSKVGDMFNRFYHENLPFELTGAQKRVVREIRADVNSNRQMNRLLQGDVGSGKTLVALLSMLLAKDNGYQACILAPTEILAEQHFATIRRLLGSLPVRVELLTGSTRQKERVPLFQALETGEVDILVGTHAVLEDNVLFYNLGLVVIDEQHRFGVVQRAKMWAKNSIPPHILVMTATPIPRTLAMTLYGDLEVSVIDELPPGRKPITTTHIFRNRADSMYSFMRKQLQEGRQVYVVYPLINESEKLDLKNLEDGYRHLCNVFCDFRLSKLHGKMKPKEKDEEMRRFASGETQVLVSTTVIEVGVDVPNASVMVIENAERFGLSQLHQLRGRVGRGASQSYCILVTDYKLSEDTRKRMEIMTTSNDGFEIAEADLKLRGPGDMEGTQQSGIAFDLKIANLARDEKLLQYVREVARAVVNADPERNSPLYKVVWERLRAIKDMRNWNWGAIS